MINPKAESDSNLGIPSSIPGTVFSIKTRYMFVHIYVCLYHAAFASILNPIYVFIYLKVEVSVQPWLNFPSLWSLSLLNLLLELVKYLPGHLLECCHWNVLVLFPTAQKNILFALLWNLKAMEWVYLHINKTAILHSTFGLKKAGRWQHLYNKGISIDGWQSLKYGDFYWIFYLKSTKCTPLKIDN